MTADGGLHAVSLAIGELRGQLNALEVERRREAAQAREDREKISDSLDRIHQDIQILKTHEPRIVKTEKSAEDWEKTKNRGIGYLAGAGLGGAGAFAGISAILKKWGFL